MKVYSSDGWFKDCLDISSNFLRKYSMIKYKQRKIIII